MFLKKTHHADTKLSQSLRRQAVKIAFACSRYVITIELCCVIRLSNILTLPSPQPAAIKPFGAIDKTRTDDSDPTGSSPAFNSFSISHKFKTRDSPPAINV